MRHLCYDCGNKLVSESESAEEISFKPCETCETDIYQKGFEDGEAESSE